MGSLRDALIKAGAVSKKDLEREKVRKQHTKTSSKIHKDHLRIVCDVCGKTAPDVERYQHRNRLIEGKEWLCLMRLVMLFCKLLVNPHDFLAYNF